ncbi:hypothetical protein PPL_03235 [Heterostelium album PN500]|uniref:Uncharacterized protein n=1 Tax=Heterostelium pallidum (strain ATCC 26659 / Pp 5 / PN500) TaxID=670386 RepID=D3B4B3_HETP5|nr:hypothetical protein PPL_03235 [Heterostelium album PN500]EFA84161.1 hypothetical protein PPL_03235 [Heterostelium album PN500]|eukprot:XP_020436278.1 hypothetical protein PPL_03235 [Heterostelium album PN500]
MIQMRGVAIEFNPTEATLYYILAMTLSGGESITLHNGQSMTQKLLYLKTKEIDLQIHYHIIYLHLYYPDTKQSHSVMFE